MFDKTGTIGKRKCEISLGKILANQEPKYRSAILKLLRNCRRQIKSLYDIKNIPDRKSIATLVMEHFYTRLEEISGMKTSGVPVTDVVVSHTMCCIKAYYKDAQESWRSGPNKPHIGME